jgi:sulfonate transport system substrate-binding protein
MLMSVIGKALIQRQNRVFLLNFLGALALSCVVARPAFAEAPPEVIRIGAPAVSGSQQSIMGAEGVARVKGWLEEEFHKEGTRVEFPGFHGGAATVNQALANGQIDFAYSGDLMAIIGRSAGLRTRVILPCGKFENAYLAVPPTSTIASVKDLRGKRVAYLKGSYLHLQVIKILAANGMTESDLKSINLDYSTAAGALAGGDVDALFGGLETLVLRDRNIAKLVYSTRSQPPQLTGQAAVLVREEFADRYPQTTARLVKVWLKAADWSSVPAHRDDVLRIWASGSRTFEEMRDNYGDKPLVERLSPLLDPFLREQFRHTQELAFQIGLLRGAKIDMEQWFDPRYLDQGLRELGLQNRWVSLDAQGHPIS